MSAETLGTIDTYATDGLGTVEPRRRVLRLRRYFTGIELPLY